MYLTHITISTGHTRRVLRDEVGDDILSALAPWLDALIKTDGQIPLPVPSLSHHSASARAQAGSLILTLWGPAAPHTLGNHAPGAIPLITLGVAQRSRHGANLWGMLVGQLGGAAGLKKPTEPWCGVVVHPSIGAYLGDLAWMGDFERCVAWAWITRNPQIAAM